MTKKIISYILVFIFVFLMSGCNTTDDNISGSEDIWLIANDERIANSTKLSEYDSPYTAGYKNKDGTFTLYIFSAPVQYKIGNKRYAPIDNSITESEKKGFVYENKANAVKTYFPKSLSEKFKILRGTETFEFQLNDVTAEDAKKEKYINMYGSEVNAVVYKSENIDYVFYPNSAGIKMESVLKNADAPDTISYTYETSDMFLINKYFFSVSENANYLEFKRGNKTRALFYPTLSKDSEGLIARNKYTSNEESQSVELEISDTGQYPIKAEASFELYENKMPDSTVNSVNDINTYLSNYHLVCNDDINGISKHFVRLRVNYFMPAMFNTSVQSASFNMMCLGGEKTADISLNRVMSQWSSTQMTWKSKGDVSSAVEEGLVQKENGYLSFGITDYIITCIYDVEGFMESRGLSVQRNFEGGEPTYLASADNVTYPTYLTITLNGEPDEFLIRDNINEVD